MVGVWKMYTVVVAGISVVVKTSPRVVSTTSVASVTMDEGLLHAGAAVVATSVVRAIKFWETEKSDTNSIVVGVEANKIEVDTDALLPCTVVLALALALAIEELADVVLAAVVERDTGEAVEELDDTLEVVDEYDALDDDELVVHAWAKPPCAVKSGLDCAWKGS